MKASIVAILGSIIPAPFAMPATDIFLPPNATVAMTVFGRVSEVMIARLAAALCSSESESFDAASAIPFATFSIGINSPILPVEHTRTSSLRQPAAAAASSHIFSASSEPRAPVHALALPLLATIARILGEASRRAMSSNTGEAFTSFVVNTPAASAGVSETTSAKSRREKSPLFLMSHAAAPTLKPFTNPKPATSSRTSMSNDLSISQKK